MRAPISTELAARESVMRVQEASPLMKSMLSSVPPSAGGGGRGWFGWVGGWVVRGRGRGGGGRAGGAGLLRSECKPRRHMACVEHLMRERPARCRAAERAPPRRSNAVRRPSPRAHRQPRQSTQRGTSRGGSHRRTCCDGGWYRRAPPSAALCLGCTASGTRDGGHGEAAEAQRAAPADGRVHTRARACCCDCGCAVWVGGEGGGGAGRGWAGVTAGSSTAGTHIDINEVGPLPLQQHSPVDDFPPSCSGGRGGAEGGWAGSGQAQPCMPAPPREPVLATACATEGRN